MQENNHYKAGLYLRLSKDDENDGESVSIGTQDGICQGVFLQKCVSS